MTNRVSPFAALTGAEKQIKWLEYQSVRLPYIQSGMEDVPDTPAAVPQSSPAPSAAKREQAISQRTESAAGQTLRSCASAQRLSANPSQPVRRGDRPLETG